MDRGAWRAMVHRVTQGWTRLKQFSTHQTSPSQRRSVLGEELTHLKRPWCWERLKPGEEGDNRGWDGWMVSPTQWTRVWVNSGSWWWTGRPGVLRFMGLQRVGHNWMTELNWTYHYNILNSWKTSWKLIECLFKIIFLRHVSFESHNREKLLDISL